MGDVSGVVGDCLLMASEGMVMGVVKRIRRNHKPLTIAWQGEGGQALTRQFADVSRLWPAGTCYAKEDKPIRGGFTELLQGLFEGVTGDVSGTGSVELGLDNLRAMAENPPPDAFRPAPMVMSLEAFEALRRAMADDADGGEV